MGTVAAPWKPLDRRRGSSALGAFVPCGPDGDLLDARSAGLGADRAWPPRTSISLRAEGGNAAKRSAAGGYASSAAARSAGTSSRSGPSSTVHEPSSLARSIAARPAGCHPAGRDQPLDARLVGGGPDAARRALREVELAPILVHGPGRAVDPAEAERLLDGRLVVEALAAAPGAPHHEPGAADGRMVGLQPGTPGRAILWLDEGSVVEGGHGVSLRRRPA